MPSEAVIQAIRRAFFPDDEDNQETYAWLITVDHLYTDEGFGYDEAGTEGPYNADYELLDRLRTGQGFQFKMYDDDGDLYYSGLCSEADHFGPLDDFGAPNAGATEIRYLHGDKYVTL